MGITKEINRNRMQMLRAVETFANRALTILEKPQVKIAISPVTPRAIFSVTMAATLFVLTVTSSASAAPVRFIVKLCETADLQRVFQLSGKLPAPGATIVRDSVVFHRPKVALAVPPKRTSHYRGEAIANAKNPLRYALIAISDGSRTTIADIAQQLGPHNIEYVEIDPILMRFEFPTDELFSQQWHLVNDGQEYIGIERVDGIENDFRVTVSGLPNEDVGLRGHYQNANLVRKRPLIAIIDTGVDDLHPELQQSIWRNPDEIPDNGIDDDHNGYVDDTWGWDVSGDSLRITDFLSDNMPTDEIGHGSHIAGIICAAENGFGVVGIAPQAEIMSVKIFPNAFGSVGAEAIIYAVNNGADIINVSWGTPFRSRFLDEAFAYAVANDVFVAVASGNSSDNTRFQPADIEALFTVGASNSVGKVTFFSTYGAHIDVVAPGRDILSIRGRDTDMYASAGEPYLRIVAGEYYLSDGTSMAAPMVAGAAGFLLSVRPELTAVEIADALRSGARDIVQPYDTGASYPGADSLSGWGALDIDRSLALIGGATFALIEPRDYTRVTDDFAIRAIALDGYAGGWTLEYGIGATPESFMRLITGIQPPTDSVLFIYSDSLPGGLITLRLLDDLSDETRTRVYVSRPSRTELIAPQDGDTLFGVADIIGFAHSHDYDSLRLILTSDATGVSEALYSTTAEQYGGVIHRLELGVRQEGTYQIALESFSSTSVVRDSSNIFIKSLLHPGWPVALSDFPAISPVAADLDGD
ncbi:S8 family serine peptidase, partial [bacterium AH-315-F03]|nr:S8 family serine peptidase [bacterium AH-315-F03]